MLVAYHFAAAVFPTAKDGTALPHRYLSTALVVALREAAYRHTKRIHNHHLLCLYHTTVCLSSCHHFLCHFWRWLRHDHTWLLWHHSRLQWHHTGLLGQHSGLLHHRWMLWCHPRHCDRCLRHHHGLLSRIDIVRYHRCIIHRAHQDRLADSCHLGFIANSFLLFLTHVD